MGRRRTYSRDRAWVVATPARRCTRPCQWRRPRDQGADPRCYTRSFGGTGRRPHRPGCGYRKSDLRRQPFADVPGVAGVPGVPGVAGVAGVAGARARSVARALPHVALVSRHALAPGRRAWRWFRRFLGRHGRRGMRRPSRCYPYRPRPRPTWAPEGGLRGGQREQEGQQKKYRDQADAHGTGHAAYRPTAAHITPMADVTRPAEQRKGWRKARQSACDGGSPGHPAPRRGPLRGRGTWCCAPGSPSTRL